MVEKAGLRLKDTLLKADPWGGPPCPRTNCKICESNKEEVICRSKTWNMLMFASYAKAKGVTPGR